MLSNQGRSSAGRVEAAGQLKPLKQQAKASILNPKGHALLAPLRFIWNATRGHRLIPWRSEYLRWRVETYSGLRAERLTAKDIFAFVWTSRWELLSYLIWTDRVERDARRRT